MTDFNKHNPYPDIAIIRCPRCQGRAEFRRAFSLIGPKSWKWWAKRLWPSTRATSWDATERWHPGDAPPAWRGWIVIEHDPDLFAWKQPSGGYSRTDDGIVMCLCQVGRKRHVLQWPADAYYRFQMPQGLLWAWDRQGVEALAAFIESTERDPAAHGPHYLFLRHIPSAFLAAKNRDTVVKHLRRALA